MSRNWVMPVTEGMSADLPGDICFAERIMSEFLGACGCDFSRVQHPNGVLFFVVEHPQRFFDKCLELLVDDNVPEFVAEFMKMGGDDLQDVAQYVEDIVVHAVDDVDDGPPSWKTLTKFDTGKLYLAVAPADLVGGDSVMRRLV